MKQEELQVLFNDHKDSFGTIKQQIESDIIRVENYKGEFYEIFPFSYQRHRLKRGKPIKNMDRIKNTNHVRTYGFNDKDKIIEIRKGIDLKDQFYYQFLFYQKYCIKSLDFRNDKTLLNISFYFLNEDGKVLIMYMKGMRGGREEHYKYDENGTLINITIRQFDELGIEHHSLIHTFNYHTDGSLKSIEQSSLDNDYSEIIWQ